MKRLFDIVAALSAIAILLLPGLFLSVWIALDSKGGALFSQRRVGKLGVPFQLLKFRSMRHDAEAEGQLTVGERDPRVTSVGHILRKYKLDELPQLINILKGEMSIVGPRPEVAKYVAMYTDEQKKVLRVRPGLTDRASLLYFEENTLLAQSDDPEKTYIEEIMPAKLVINLKYVEGHDMRTDMAIIWQTIKRILTPPELRERAP